MFTDEIFASMVPGLSEALRQSYPPLLQQAMLEFGINTTNRQAAFMAQITHESAGLKRFVENLNYSAEGLFRVFRKYFPTLDSARPFHRQPEKIANRVYANRIGNGPESSGDGFRFRGRGAIQLTGRANYIKFGEVLIIDLVGNPDIAATPEIAFRTAGAYWKSRGCNELADSQNIREITRRINGGFIGLAERQALYARMLQVLTSAGSGGATRGVPVRVRERDVPARLSRGIYPGIHLVGEEAPAASAKKKPSAKKATSKKAAVKKAAAKKTGAKKAAVKNAGAKKAVPKRPVKKAVKTASGKASTRKAPATKSGRK